MDMINNLIEFFRILNFITYSIFSLIIIAAIIFLIYRVIKEVIKELTRKY